MSVRTRSFCKLLRPLSSKIIRRKQVLAGAVAGVGVYGVEPLERRVLLSAGFSPLQIRRAYGLADAFGNSLISFNGTAGDGTGQTIAIVVAYDDSSIINDADKFNQDEGLPRFNIGGPTLTKFNQLGQTSPLPSTDASGTIEHWDRETAQDVEWAHAAAPQANIDVVEATGFDLPDMDIAEQHAATLSGVTVVSNSWGNPQSASTAGTDSIFTGGPANVAYVFASGDNGGGGTEWPPMSPYVISVGGTSLSINTDSTYGGENAWSSTSGGVITAYPQSTSSWQAGKVNGLSAQNGQNYHVYPDVSAIADFNTPLLGYDTDVANSSPPIPSGSFEAWGTSVGAPIWAGMIAIADQGKKIRNGGTPNPLSTSAALTALYDTVPLSAFRDVTTGSAGGGIYNAGTGYDLATGLGTPIANVLIPILAGYGSGNQLSFASPNPPSPVVAGGTGALPTLMVDVKNSSGNIITTDNSPVTLTAYYHGVSDSAELAGASVTVNAVNGIATFNDLWLTPQPNLGGSYTVQATDGTNAPAVLNFTVTAASARNMSPAAVSPPPAVFAGTGSPAGRDPQSGLVADSQGDLFGTTNSGGTSGDGTVFELQHGSFTYTLLHTFTGGSDGQNPTGRLALDSSGDIYGTTTSGGTVNGVTGYGTVFELSPSGSLLHAASFTGANGIGAQPYGGVTLDSSGNLWGTTVHTTNSTSGYGTVFEIKNVTSGGSFILSPTATVPFSNTNGANPYGAVVFDTAGNLYGTTYTGAIDLPDTTAFYGSVFEIPAGTTSIVTLTAFTGGSSPTGGSPKGPLVMDAAGNLYGTSSTGVFELDKGAITAISLASISNPTAGIAIDSTGDIFGVTQGGTVFEVLAGSTPGSNAMTVLTPDSQASLYSGVLLDSQGDLFGTTESGGTPGDGEVFEIPGVASRALPQWLKAGSAGPGTWDGTNLTIATASPVNFAKAAIIADPHTVSDTPIIKVTGSGAQLEFEVPAGNATEKGNNPGPLSFTIGGLTLQTGATAAFAQTAKPDVEILHLSTLSIDVANGSEFDLGNNKLFLTYGSGVDPMNSSTDPSGSSDVWIFNLLASAYNSGAWNGTGVISSAAAQDALQRTAIGYADSADGLIAGQPTNTVELMYTLYGDTTLAGTVGSNDFNTLTQHYHQTSGGTWDTGDFNYDGSIDFSDFTLLTRTYNTALYDPSFAPQMTYAVSAPVWIASADLNGDGYADLVVTGAFSGVFVLLGNGDGTFAAPVSYATGMDPSSVVVADVSGDGKPDLIVTDAYSSSVSVLLGNGDGTFQAQQTFAVGGDPNSVAVADMNGDGKEDLVVANRSDGAVSVLLGNGDGTFQNQQTFATSAYPVNVSVADVNGDGKPDVLVACGSFSGYCADVLLGNGDGTLQAPITLATGRRPSWITPADVNGDGKIDLVVANSYDGTVSIFLGNGDGTFQAQRTIAAGYGTWDVQVADMNGDGIPDLVVTDNATVSVLEGNGDGTFQVAQTFAVQNGSKSVAISDVNGDGKPDIIVANSGNGSISVLINTSPY